MVDVLFPRVCTVCHTTLVEGEDIMCLKCLLDLPRVGFTDYHENELTRRLTSLHAPIDRATSFYYHIPGTDYVSLIHDTKYNRRPVVGRRLARMHAHELLPKGFFDGINLIIPIPLHFTKEWRRGYNQSLEIALGLSEATGIPVGDNLIATRPHSTQTRKKAAARRVNSIGTFRAQHADELAGLHVLVVDDVITTGSTILSGLEALHNSSPTTHLSAYSLALAKLR
ncbi:MAG: ComF family protein [Duncaniella sp.]|nr:ComF family protein [Duncaniella sp.]